MDEAERKRRGIESSEEIARRQALRDAHIEFCCPPLELDQPKERPAQLPANAVWPPKVRMRSPDPALQRRRFMALMALAFTYPDIVREARASERSPAEWVKSWGFLEKDGAAPSRWMSAAVLLDRHEAASFPSDGPELPYWCVPRASISDDVDDAQSTGQHKVEQFERRELRRVLAAEEFEDERDGSLHWIAGPIIVPVGAPHSTISTSGAPRVPQLPDAARRRELSREELELEVAATVREYLSATEAWAESSAAAGLRGREAERVKADLLLWAHACVRAAGRQPLDVELLNAAADASVYVTERHRDRLVRRVAETLNLAPPRQKRGRPRVHRT